MKGKILVLLLLLLTVLFVSGCAEKDTGTVPDDSNSSVPEAAAAGQNTSLSSESGKEYVVRLEYYNVFRPSELDIKVGDTISWWSGKRQGNFVLVSEEKLFEDKELAYSVPYSYTFNEAGTYLFTVKDVPEMNFTARVT
jgi:plastocyanin